MLTTYQSPTADDRALWDLHLSAHGLPVVLAADELGIFQSLKNNPVDVKALATGKGLSERAVRATVPMLAAMGLLVQREGIYTLTNLARNFLLPESPYYWGPVFEVLRRIPASHEAVVTALKGQDKLEDAPVNVWESGGEMPESFARMVASYMHSHSLAAAVGLARAPVFQSIRRLLDVGGGSGCYSIAIAQANPNIWCSVMDLPAMCQAANTYMAAAAAQGRLDTVALDMFRERWPVNYDGMLFSNIFHDWDLGTCRTLAQHAFEALPSGGRIVLHEALLDDSRDGPLTAAAFSVLMLLSTRGQQFTLRELAQILEFVGFTSVEEFATHSLFSAVSAVKP
jgi:hypothetical protein